jgi:hypothetical protein|tara:strand:+ start:232 stop:429 length:198 start_codon:yes stop_codon:yes gene_type:complete
MSLIDPIQHLSLEVPQWSLEELMLFLSKLPEHMQSLDYQMNENTPDSDQDLIDAAIASVIMMAKG